MGFRFLSILLILCLTSCSQKAKIDGQKLRLNLYCEPPSLDSRKATDATSMNVLLMVFEGLTRVGPNHMPELAAAEAIEISNDQKTYTFRLRESYWTNGDPVTATDFEYAWKKILDPKFPSLFAYKLYVIKNAAEIKEGKLQADSLGVKVLDDRTLEVTLNYPTPYFLELTAFPTFFPIHKKNDEKYPKWANEGGAHFVCNGPFYLKKWDHENEIIVKKNLNYWDSDAVLLDTIALSMIDDTTTEYYMFEMGELDWAGSPLSNLPPEFLPALKNEGKITILPATAVYYYKINTEKFPLQNQKIRRALGLAINRKDIVEHITQAEQRPALALIPPMPGWEMSSHLFRDGDTSEAKSLFEEGLKELNLKKGSFPSIVLSYNTNREHQKIAQAVQQQWKDVLNITVELENSDWNVYLSKINKQDYQIGRMGWIGDFHDPVSFLEPFKLKDNPRIGGNNETGWENLAYAQCLTDAEKEINPEKRATLLRNAEKILIDEMPIIPIYFINYSFIKKPYVKGVYISPLGFADYKRAYIQK